MCYPGVNWNELTNQLQKYIILYTLNLLLTVSSSYSGLLLLFLLLLLPLCKDQFFLFHMKFFYLTFFLYIWENRKFNNNLLILSSFTFMIWRNRFWMNLLNPLLKSWCILPYEIHYNAEKTKDFAFVYSNTNHSLTMVSTIEDAYRTTSHPPQGKEYSLQELDLQFLSFCWFSSFFLSSVYHPFRLLISIFISIFSENFTKLLVSNLKFKLSILFSHLWAKYKLFGTNACC